MLQKCLRKINMDEISILESDFCWKGRDHLSPKWSLDPPSPVVRRFCFALRSGREQTQARSNLCGARSFEICQKWQGGTLRVEIDGQESRRKPKPRSLQRRRPFWPFSNFIKDDSSIIKCRKKLQSQQFIIQLKTIRNRHRWTPISKLFNGMRYITAVYRN